MLSFRNITALIVDDMQDMRSVLRIQLSTLGVGKIHQAASIRDAMRLIGENRYDVILCDYYMGDDTSGQQWLEYLRAGHRIPVHTLFVMVTAECSYEAVANAVEHAPDDYLVKPFTAELLKLRLEKVWARKEALMPVLDRLERKDLYGAVRECDRLVELGTRYRHDVLRIKGKALLTLGRHIEARAVYELVLGEKPYPWARYGHACSLHGEGNPGDAQQVLEKLTRDAPRYLEAYDLLTDIHLERGDIALAQAVALGAAEVSPSVARQKKVGLLALDADNLELAQLMLSRAVSRNRHGLLKSSEEYAALALTLVRQGEAMEALKVAAQAHDLALAKRAFERMELKTVEAEAQLELGNEKAAAALVDEALKAHAALPPDELALANEKALSLARVAVRAGRVAEAKALAVELAANNQDNVALVSRAKDFFRELSEAESQAAEAALEEELQRNYRRNNDAVALATQGKVREAAALFMDSARSAPENFVINLNAAKALVMVAQSQGLDEDLRREIEVQLEHCEALRPMSPALLKLISTWELIAQAAKRVRK